MSQEQSRPRPKAYIVPVAERGFVQVDPISNPISYALDREDGTPAIRAYWPTVDEAVAAGQAAGFEVIS